jgi:hypothetical protein
VALGVALGLGQSGVPGGGTGDSVGSPSGAGVLVIGGVGVAVPAVVGSGGSGIRVGSGVGAPHGFVGLCRLGPLLVP